MEKIYGATKRHDALIVYGTKRCVLIYGFGTDDGAGYDYRKTFDHRPSAEEVRETIVAQINANTDSRILTGFVWNGLNIWLSTENQFNFKAAYDIAVQSGGATLPVKFKLGETDGTPVYHTFEDLQEFTDFYTNAIAYINRVLNEGWQEKDTINMSAFGF